MTPRVDPDSLAARLARAEAAIALLRQQLGTGSESAVRARSRVAFEVSARLLTNASWTSRPADDLNVPSFATPEIRTRATSALGLSVRQTRVGAGLVVRDVLGGTLDADADVDFYGGTRDASGNRPLFPEPRLRTAGARLEWPSGFVMVGAETPFVSDLDPRSLAAIGVPVFGAAGNLWNYGGGGGSRDALYFAAGINGEADGLFGSITTTPEPGPLALVAAGAGLLAAAVARRHRGGAASA